MLYVALMWIVMARYSIIHPGVLLRRIRRARIDPALDGSLGPMAHERAYGGQRSKADS